MANRRTIHYALIPRPEYKYRLTRALVLQCGITPPEIIASEYVTLTSDGTLILKAGYAWDGASGPAVDTPSFMAASAGHDALYQLIRVGALSIDYFRAANKAMYTWCREDGMPLIRAQWVYYGVKLFGKEFGGLKPDHANQT